MHCQYYQATVVKKRAWFVSGCFRNEDHVAFARALDGSSTVFEFFVPKDQEERFLALINFLQEDGAVVSYEQKENRIMAMLADKIH